MNKKTAKQFMAFCKEYYSLQELRINLEFKKENKDWSGYVQENSAYQDYTILVNKYNVDKGILPYIIGHEMTHINQFMSGRLDWSDDDFYIWDLVAYSTYESHIPEVYFFYPWEIDARQMEEPLIYFFDHQET